MGYGNSTGALPPSPPKELKEAFQPAIENGERDGSYTVRAPPITVQELDTVINALKHPPQRPDYIAAAATIIAMVGVMLRTLISGYDKTTGTYGNLHTADLVVLGLTLTAIVIQAGRVIRLGAATHPHHEQALQYVSSLRDGSKTMPPNQQAGLSGPLKLS